MKRRKLNECGSTLVLALLVILVFSVLGLAVLSNTVGETKRTVSTETNSQAQQYALDGFAYFEKAFRQFIETENHDDYPDGIVNAFLAEYGDWQTVNAGNTEVKAELVSLENQYNIEVTSKGITDSGDKTLVGYYMLEYEFDNDDVVFEIADFDAEDTIKLNVSKDNNLLNVGLLNNLLDIEAISLSNDKYFFRIPENGALLEASLVANLIKLNLPDDTGNFETVEDNSVIAVREEGVLKAGLEVAELEADINLLTHTAVENTNVLIDGGYVKGFLELESDFVKRFEEEKKPCKGLFGCIGDLIGSVIGGITDLLELTNEKLTELLSGLLGSTGEWLGNKVSWLVDGVVRILDKHMDFNDIHFKKFAVVGNVTIQQNTFDNPNPNDPREFTFKNGLFVKNSLIIGGGQNISNIKDFDNSKSGNNGHQSNLLLSGDMVTMESLYMNNVDLTINDDNTNIYVHGDANIDNACLKSDHDNKIGIFVKEKLTIENNFECSPTGPSIYNGIFYAENGIEINTNGEEMVINGAVIGDVTVDHPEKLTINWNPKYLPQIKIKNIDLIPQGRVVDYH